MVELYVSLVKTGKRTCDLKNKDVRQVPKHLRDEVLRVLNEQGFDENGKEINK